MRYILNNSGYIEAISFNNVMTCNNKSCTEYTGSVPTGYESLENWSENANINAYKIVNGNLTYDSGEDMRLQTLWASQLSANSGGINYSTEEQIIGTWIDGKPIYRKVVRLSSEGQHTSKFYALGFVSNEVENIIKMEGIFNDAGALIYKYFNSIGTLTTLNVNYASAIYFNKNDGNVYLEFAGSDGSITAFVVVEYTKN